MTLYNFGQHVPPLKKILASSLVLMVTRFVRHDDYDGHRG